MSRDLFGRARLTSMNSGDVMPSLIDISVLNLDARNCFYFIIQVKL